MQTSGLSWPEKQDTRWKQNTQNIFGANIYKKIKGVCARVRRENLQTIWKVNTSERRGGQYRKSLRP